MKRKTALIVFCFVCISRLADATTYTWNPTNGNSANDVQNWVPSGIPGSNDEVVFDLTSMIDCTWDIASVGSFSVLNGYTGTIDMGNANVTINGDLIINDGIVLATSGDLTFKGTGSHTFGLSGGTFNANNGNIIVCVDVGEVFTFSGAIVLRTLTIDGGASNNSNSSPRDIDFGSNLTTDFFVMAVQNREYDYQGTIHVKNILDIGGNLMAASYATTPSNNTATFILDGNNATILGVDNNSKAPLPNLEINVSGNITLVDNINIIGDWTCLQGTHVVGSSVTTFMGTSVAQISGTAVAFDNLEIDNGAVVTMPANVEVKIGGDLDISGTLLFQNTTSLGFDAHGGTNQSVNGAGMILAGITAYGAATARNVSFNLPVRLLDSLSVGSMVTLATGNSFTLGSTSALTCRVSELGFQASITGSATVETMIPGGSTGWALMGVRGVNGQSVSDWDTWYSSLGFNGIPMTCVGCYQQPDAMGSWFESIQGWDETTSFGYDTNMVSGSSLDPGDGYWVYVGDGTINTNDLKLKNTGILNTGVTAVPVTAGGAQSGLNLVANPYASPISWDDVMNNVGNSSTVNDAIYAWNADAGVYTTYIATVANPGAPNGIDNIIAGGQGFYVEAISNGNLVFNESNKSDGNTSSNPLIRTSASSPAVYFRLYLQGANDKDVCTFRIHGNATEAFDKQYDAWKLFQSPGYVGYPCTYDKYTSISSKDVNGDDYSIQSIPPYTGNKTIPILARVSSSGTFTISAGDYHGFNSCLGILDRLDNSYHDLSSSAYVFTIADTTSTPRFELFLCREDSVTGVSELDDERSNSVFISREGNTVFVKTSFDKYARGSVSVYNLLGQKIVEDVSIEGTMTSTAIPLDNPDQVLIISVKTDRGSAVKKFVFN